MRSRKDRTQTPGHHQRSAVPTPEQTEGAGEIRSQKTAQRRFQQRNLKNCPKLSLEICHFISNPGKLGVVFTVP